MTNEQRKNFSVITNEKSIEDNFRKERIRSYQTNPMKIQGASLREQFMMFANGEGGRKFTVEELLRSC